MKYLTVSLSHPNVLRGGAQYVAKDLHDEATADEGVEAAMLAAIDAHRFPQYAKVGASIVALPEGRNEYLMPGRRFKDFYHLMYDQRRNKAVAHFLEDFRPDVIHIHHSLWVGLDFIRLARKVLPDVRILYTLHEYLPICYAKGQLYRYAEREICSNSAPDQCVRCFPDRTTDEFILRRRTFLDAFDLVDHFIAPSRYLADRYAAWGIAADRISVVANGHVRRRPEEWTPTASPQVNRFGFFGQFIDAKGIDILLAAASEVAKETGVEVMIFGGNKEYATEEYQARINGILDDPAKGLSITEVGSYSRENVFDLMNSIDWLVVPSVWPETFALVVSEAWDARRPVISSRAGGLTDRISDGVDGRLFSPGSVSELAQIMADCVGNKELWTKLSGGVTDEVSVRETWAAHKALARA